jgi:hypothetical protein
VTLGADVAVTSLVLQKAARVYPMAECVVLGPAAAADVLPDLAGRVRIVDCPYLRRGDLLSRLEAWVAASQVVRSEAESSGAVACVTIDPDSRLTQLGLLPLAPAEGRSLLFESRSYRRAGLHCLGELTACWLEESLGPDGGPALRPLVRLDSESAAQAAELARQTRSSASRRLVTVAFGVGGNERKRLGGGFELDLVRGLLAGGDAVVIDKGVDEEVDRVEAIVARLRAEGVPSAELDGPHSDPGRAAAAADGRPARLIAHRRGLRALVALIAASDLYVGYDSALQHVAAALGVPAIDVFAGAPNERFARRWRPWSESTIVVKAAPGMEKSVLHHVLDAASRQDRT